MLGNTPLGGHILKMLTDISIGVDFFRCLCYIHPMKKLNVAIIGVGHLGARHLKIYHELNSRVNLVGLCDLKPLRTLRLASHYDNIPYYNDYKDLTREVDAVNICVPTVGHYEIAKFFVDTHGLKSVALDNSFERALLDALRANCHSPAG